MDAIAPFVAGLIAGIVLVLAVQGIRRPPAGLASDEPLAPASSGLRPLGHGATKAVRASFTVGGKTRTVRHETFQIRDDRTGTVMNIVDGATTIETGGTTYDRLADVPEPQRAALEAELRRIEALDLPDLVRDEVQRVLAAPMGPGSEPPQV